MSNLSVKTTGLVVGLILALSSPALAKTAFLQRAGSFMKRMIPKRFQPKPHPAQVKILIAKAKMVRPSFAASVASSTPSTKFDNYLCDQVSKTRNVPVHSLRKLGKLVIMGAGKERLAKDYAKQHEGTLSAKDFVSVGKISPYTRTSASILGHVAKSQFSRWSLKDLNTLRKGAPDPDTKFKIWNLMNRKMGKPEKATHLMSLKERFQAAF